MNIDSKNYRLTKHGRRRFIKRVGSMSDRNILTTAQRGLPGYKFVWKPDVREGLRLITVLYQKRQAALCK